MHAKPVIQGFDLGYPVASRLKEPIHLAFPPLLLLRAGESHHRPLATTHTQREYCTLAFYPSYCKALFGTDSIIFYIFGTDSSPPSVPSYSIKLTLSS